MFLSKGSYLAHLYTSLQACIDSVEMPAPLVDFVGTPSPKDDPLDGISSLSPRIQSYIFRSLPVLYRLSLPGSGPGPQPILYIGARGSAGLPPTLLREGTDLLRVVLLLQKLFHREGRRQVIYYYPTPFRKTFGAKTKAKAALTPNEINSGVTFLEPAHQHAHKNGMIVLFRREEARKVLIHELIHSFHLDYQLCMHHQHQQGKGKQPICSNYPILLNEAFTEAMATLLHIYFVMGGAKAKARKALRQEVAYELALARRILAENGLEVRDLPKLVAGEGGECLARFQQQTNVFSYYILKPLLLQKIDHFDAFLKNHTREGEIRPEGAPVLEAYVLQSLRDPASHFALALAKSPLYRGNSLRMVMATYRP